MSRNRQWVHLLFILLFLFLFPLASAQSSNSLKPIKNCGDVTKQVFLSTLQNYKRDPAIESSIENTFPAKKYQLIDGLTKGNKQLVLESIRGKQGPYVLHIGSIILLFVLLLILVPILLCTSCCRKCCTRPILQPYSECEIKWPTLCLMILILALIGLCIAIILVNYNYEPKFNDFKCSLGIMVNDVMEGGSYEKEGIKFGGLTPLLVSMDAFVANISNVKALLKKNMNTKSDTMKAMFQQANTLLNEVPKIPNTNGSELSLQYPKPLLSPTPSTLSKSLFIPILGTKSSPNTLIGTLFQSLTSYNNSLTSLSSWSDNLTELLNESLPSSQLKQPLKTKIEAVQQLEFNIQSTIGALERGIKSVYIIGSYILLGVTLLVCVFLCFGVLCLGCWDQYPCGSKVSCCCGLLWFLGLVYFVIAVGFALANPAVLYGCQYATEGFGSEAGYTANIQKWINGSQVGSVIRKCLTSSKQPYELYTNLSLSNNPNITLLTSYPPLPSSPSQPLTNLSAAYNQTLATIQQYRAARKLDISDPEMLEEIKQIAQVQECFPDRWVPSLKQDPEFISCGTINETADNMTCGSRDAFMGRRPGCVGCMDTYLVLERFTGGGMLASELNLRYERCQEVRRQSLVLNLTLLWSNFYKQKKQKLGPAKDRASKLQPSLTQSQTLSTTQLDPAHTQLKSFLSNPLLTPNSTLNPKDNDCRVIGKGIDNSINIACSEGLMYVYNLRYLYTAAAIVILFICCCSVCLLSRSRHQQRVKRYLENGKPNPYQMQNVPLTERKVSQEELRSNQPYFNN